MELDRAYTRREQLAGTIFSTWVVVGLFLDGWAHNAGKPEDFWTPWHAVLYSGFVVGGLWFAVGEVRLRRAGVRQLPDRLLLAGFALFAVGGVADAVWHEVFGVEEDIEALLSPTHLVLMVGGLLLVTGSVRGALRDGASERPTFGSFLPAAIGITLAVAIVAFFLQFASPLHVHDGAVFSGAAPDSAQVRGVVAILLTNALLVGAVVWTLQRWSQPPPGTFTLVLGGTALLMAGLHAFAELVLVAPLALGGAVADLLVARGQRLRTVVTVTAAVLWPAWFATYHARWGLGWTVELWTGTIFLAVLTAFALGSLVSDRSPAPRGTEPDPVAVPVGAGTRR